MLEDLTGDRSCHLSSGATALDHDRHHELRVEHRGNADEPCGVDLANRVVGFDDLRRAGLSADRANPFAERLERPPSGPEWAVDDLL